VGASHTAKFLLNSVRAINAHVGEFDPEPDTLGVIVGRREARRELAVDEQAGGVGPA
jgi:hypothetical protein